jgi:hypothetical protein
MTAPVDIRHSDRATLAWILATYPSARRMWVVLKRLGMTRIRPDAYPWEPPRLWVASCQGGRFSGEAKISPCNASFPVGLVLHGDGYEDDWSLHS